MIVTIHAADALAVDASMIRAAIETLGYSVSAVAVTDATDGLEDLKTLRIESANYALDRAAERLDGAMKAFAEADAAYIAALGDVKP